MTQEQVRKVCNLDYRETKNRVRIQEALEEIAPLSKYAGENDQYGIPLEKIEKLVGMIVRRYHIFVTVSLSYQKEDADWYLATFHHAWQNSETVRRLDTIDAVYGCCWYDLWAKVAIYMWTLVQTGAVKKVEKDKLREMGW